VAAAVEAAESTQEAGREVEEKVGGAEYSVVRIKEGAVCKDLVDIQVSMAVAPGPVAAHEPLDSSA
jgi:hypothetical protein